MRIGLLPEHSDRCENGDEVLYQKAIPHYNRIWPPSSNTGRSPICIYLPRKRILCAMERFDCESFGTTRPGRVEVYLREIVVDILCIL